MSTQPMINITSGSLHISGSPMMSGGGTQPHPHPDPIKPPSKGPKKPKKKK